MDRATKPKPKLIDLFHEWRQAKTDVDLYAGKMSITPSLLAAEQESYKKFYKRLQECKC